MESTPAETETKLSLKLLINKKTKKLLFAESGKEFVDFLFNLLKLPIGTVSRLLTSANMIGCFGNLYSSVENLSDNFMEPDEKESLLKPTLISNHLIPLLPTDIYSATTRLYKCSTTKCTRYTTNQNDNCESPNYGHYGMGTELVHNGWDFDNFERGTGCVKGTMTYVVKDDLMVEPATPSSFMASLIKAGLNDLSGFEERIVKVGLDEALKLLKAAMVSRNVLTNVFLAKTTSATGVVEEA